jgi:molybdopterin synthase catalytic subunit
MSLEIRSEPFDPWSFLAKYRPAEGSEQKGRFGATAVFVGSMRDFNEGSPVQGMFLECYREMAHRYLENLCSIAIERWKLVDTLIVHRVGDLVPGEPIVLVAVWSAHRGEAFEACRYLMENLKSRAPFWKKEQLDAGCRWVERNTPG